MRCITNRTMGSNGMHNHMRLSCVMSVGLLYVVYFQHIFKIEKKHYMQNIHVYIAHLIIFNIIIDHYRYNTDSTTVITSMYISLWLCASYHMSTFYQLSSIYKTRSTQRNRLSYTSWPPTSWRPGWPVQCGPLSRGVCSWDQPGPTTMWKAGTTAWTPVARQDLVTRDCTH